MIRAATSSSGCRRGVRFDASIDGLPGVAGYPVGVGLLLGRAMLGGWFDKNRLDPFDVAAMGFRCGHHDALCHAAVAERLSAEAIATEALIATGSDGASVP